MSISIIAITFNEGHYLKDFIINAKKLTNKIFIVDSYSSDDTVDIAITENINIVQRKFINFSDQWNFAINNLPYNTDWVLKLDPDERLSDKIIKNINNKIINQNEFSGFTFDRRLFFLGKKINIKQEILRIWKHKSCKFSENTVNEYPIIDGKLSKISGEIDHLDSPSLDHWIVKQNNYTTLEAIELFYIYKKQGEKNYLLASIQNKRLFFLNIFIYFPMRYQIIFLYFYIMKGLFLNGYHGLLWSKLRCDVYFWIEIKFKKFKKNRKISLPINSNLGKPDQRCKQYN